jgi:hypothetical protein
MTRSEADLNSTLRALGANTAPVKVNTEHPFPVPTEILASILKPTTQLPSFVPDLARAASGKTVHHPIGNVLSKRSRKDDWQVYPY